MTKRIFPLAAAIVAASALAGAATAGTDWHIVTSRSVSGQFAGTVARATVASPRVLAVRFTGHVMSGLAVIVCTRGTSISSHSQSFTRAGLYRLTINPAHASSCNVIGSVGGSGRVQVQILKG